MLVSEEIQMISFLSSRKKKDYEEILELESDAVSQATVLEGTEPER